jgi:hypothetical protein
MTTGICIALVCHIVPVFEALRKYPLPQDVPYRHEIYTSQGLLAAFVRNSSIIFSLKNLFSSH